MTTLEKLERLVKERDASVAMDHGGKVRTSFDGRYYYGATIDEAVAWAYEAAFPTRQKRYVRWIAKR